MTIRDNEYLNRGDYHKNLDKNWRFYPVYLEKMRLVEKFLAHYGQGKKILDLGCGEGVLVEKFRGKKYNIVGVDLNYQSESVFKRDVMATGFANDAFDFVLCLDVIEHLSYEEQRKILKEISRILKRDGLLVMTIPNLAHFASRLSFLFLGKLLRTSEIHRHKGDRPIFEYIVLLKSSNFLIKKRRGLFPTFPLISLLTYFYPSKVIFWHRVLNNFFAYPNWCFLNFLVCENKKDD